MVDVEKLIAEVSFKAVPSGGPGGQHANKVSTKVVLSWRVTESSVFSDEQQQLLLKNLKTRLTKENTFILACDQTRSQLKNKEIVSTRFLKLIQKSLKTSRKRKKTKPSKAANEKRLEIKKQQAQKKSNRKNPLS